MRKRKIIIVVLLVMLLGGAGVMFLSRDSGPPIKLDGDFSAKDITQIKRAVRHRLWHDAFPGLSWQTLKALPGGVKSAWGTRIREISGNPHIVTVYVSGPGRTNWWEGYALTNGPGGWAWSYNNVYVVPD